MGGGESLTSQLAGEGRSGGTRPATRSGKACKSGGGRKTPQERGEDHFPRELKINKLAREGRSGGTA
jgi:hypothetical protein